MAKLTSPRVSVTFTTLARTAILRGSKGTVALIVRDEAEQEPFSITQASQIPTTLGKETQSYIKRTFIGYMSPPKKVVVYVMPPASEDVVEEGDTPATDSGLSAALAYMSGQAIDYLCGPADCTADEADEIATWIKDQRDNYGSKCKAVLPNCAANHCAIVNFASSGMTDGTTVWTTAEYCSRIAGLLAGTPMKIAATYAPLPELADCARLSKDEADEAVGSGQLVLRWDGRKVTLNRAVTSLVPSGAETGGELSDNLKKIKIVEIMDLIRTDITTTAEDEWIGQYPNSYDSKMLLVAAIRGYFMELKQAGLVQAGYTVDLDVEEIEAYLRGQGVNVEEMSEQQIREADTGSYVYIIVSCKILDAIEDIMIKARI